MREPSEGLRVLDEEVSFDAADDRLPRRLDSVGTDLVSTRSSFPAETVEVLAARSIPRTVPDAL